MDGLTRIYFWDKLKHVPRGGFWVFGANYLDGAGASGAQALEHALAGKSSEDADQRDSHGSSHVSARPSRSRCRARFCDLGGKAGEIGPSHPRTLPPQWATARSTRAASSPPTPRSMSTDMPRFVGDSQSSPRASNGSSTRLAGSRPRRNSSPAGWPLTGMGAMNTLATGISKFRRPSAASTYSTIRWSRVDRTGFRKNSNLLPGRPAAGPTV